MSQRALYVLCDMFGALRLLNDQLMGIFVMCGRNILGNSLQCMALHHASSTDLDVKCQLLRQTGISPWS